MQNAECRVRNEKRSGLVLSPVHSALRTRHSALKVVAREGSAPPISGCRPDVILFHHRAKENWLPGMDSLCVASSYVQRRAGHHDNRRSARPLHGCLPHITTAPRANGGCQGFVARKERAFPASGAGSHMPARSCASSPNRFRHRHWWFQWMRGRARSGSC